MAAAVKCPSPNHGKGLHRCRETAEWRRYWDFVERVEARTPPAWCPACGATEYRWDGRFWRCVECALTWLQATTRPR